MAESEELVQISGSAFLKLILHVFRFWSNKSKGEKKIVFGLLLGSIEENTRKIGKTVPLLHRDNKDLEMDDKFMKQVKSIDRAEMENNSPYEIIGWYRSSTDGVKFSARDIKNQIKFQEFNPKFISLIIDPQIYLTPGEFGFSVFRLKGDKYYTFMSDYYKIPWEIESVEDPQSILQDFRNYIKSYFMNKPLITEFTEQEIENT